MSISKEKSAPAFNGAVNLVIYAPDDASRAAAAEVKESVEKNGGKVEIRNRTAPYDYPGIH